MKPKRGRRIRWRWVVSGVFLALFVLPPTCGLVVARAKIAYLISHAKSVRAEHYVIARHFDEKSNRLSQEEIVLASKDLPSTDFNRVEDAFPVFFDLGVPGLEKMCLFNPHHRIVITDKSGKVTVIRVCFECDHLTIGDEDPYQGILNGMPFLWSFSLRRFFEQEGMPNSPETYYAAETGRWLRQLPETNAAPIGK